MELTSLCDVVRDACAYMLVHHGFVRPVVVVVSGNEARYSFHDDAMDHQGKMVLWGVLQKIAREQKPDAIVYGDTAQSIGIAPEKFKGLTEEQKLRLCSMGAQWLAEYGYGRPEEALTVIAQSEHCFCSLLVPFTRTDQGIVWGEEQWRNAPQSKIGLENRTKFYRTGEVTQ